MTPWRGRVVGMCLALGLGCRPPPIVLPPPDSYDHWDKLDARPTPAWFLDARFGIFIHWGVYSVPSWSVPGQYAEWYWYNILEDKPDNPWAAFHQKTYGRFDYKDFAPRFRAELFNADAWAELFAASGAGYVVLTAKHHEGFALWPSVEANRNWGRAWNANDVGPHRDLVGEVAAATRKRGLKFGVYYSLSEWFNPLLRHDQDRYVAEHMMPQFKDLVTRYKPSLVFGDGEGNFTSAGWRSEELLSWLFHESPSRDDVAVNDRWGNETRQKHGGYYSTEYAAGLSNGSHPWEESRGMAWSYGYSRSETAADHKSARELILLLVDMVSRGGNLLLDVGPTADGRIPALMQERLLEMGQWLSVNGEAIRGTRMAGRNCQWTGGARPDVGYAGDKVPYKLMDHVGMEPRGGQAVKQVFFTQKGGTLYAITPAWPGSELKLVDVETHDDTRVRLLGMDAVLKASRKDGMFTISVPAVSPGQLPAQHAYVFALDHAAALPAAD
jgi:alpha-L-fucosidase